MLSNWQGRPDFTPLDGGLDPTFSVSATGLSPFDPNTDALQLASDSTLCIAICVASSASTTAT